MKLLIKQRVFSWGDAYDIYDENGNVKYVVKAEIFALGHQLHVYDANGFEIGQIKQKLLTFLPRFEIEISGRTVGTISKQFTLFCPKYEIDFNNPQDELMGMMLVVAIDAANCEDSK